MSFKKKLFATLGPLLLAVVIIIGFLFAPVRLDFVDKNTVKRASNSMAVNVIKGNAIKNKAFAQGNYVPFLGSSELSRIDAFHPSVLADKYQRDYTPFLLGAAGTQSLSHFLMLQSMNEELQNKKIVFIISPQWFVKKGVNSAMFDLYYSPLQVYQWLSKVENNDASSQYFAQRLLEFPNVSSDSNLKRMLLKLKHGETLSQKDRKMCRVKMRMYEREDAVFGHFGVLSKERKIKKAEAHLPDEYNPEKLDEMAYKIGQKQTNNNDFQICNSFYSKRIMPVKDSLKDSQSNFDYRFSPEFSDFQLVLNEVAKNNIDALFIIPPVNQHWSDYTGLSQEMIQEFSREINYQLKSQGFNNVLDLTDRSSEDYFMTDTIHIGWRGWIVVDQAVAPFLEAKDTNRLNYHLANDFYTKTWQNKNPEDIESPGA